MKNHFLNFIRQKKLFDLRNDRLLIAVSGGLDSVVLCDLAKAVGLDFGVAHCNFQLRGVDSEGDEAFVKKLALRYNVPFHSVKFDTKKYAQSQGISTQMAARKLRYEWFEKTRQTFGYQYITTAHHANDNLETVLLNVTKRTGIRGLHGILPKTNHLVRPLLFATRQALEIYQQKHQISFREDASNQTNDYQRNFLRHEVVPLLKNINPTLEQTFAHNINHWQGTEAFFDWAIAHWRKEVWREEGYIIFLDIKKILISPAPSILVYEILKDYGFNPNQAQRVFECLAKTGTQFLSDTHQVLIDRNNIIITQKKELQNIDNEIIINIFDKEKNIFLDEKTNLFLEKKENINLDFLDKNVTYLNVDKLVFPLRFRHWRAGDWFCPLGMGGKKQKIQDFFSNQKLSRLEKDQVWLLENGNQDLIWIVGWRLDERYKVVEVTKELLGVVKA